MSPTDQHDARRLYRTMNTADIAQLLHVTEAEVFNAVFGTRASHRQHNANQSDPASLGREERSMP
jgi:hypothetical protein